MQSIRREFPIRTGNEKKNAFASLVTNDFCMGAVVLGFQLKKFHQEKKIDCILLVTEDVSKIWVNILSKYWIIKKVRLFKPRIHYRSSWTKIKLWKLVQYEKIVYVDSDTFLLGSIDDLFMYDEFSCVPDINPPQMCNTGVMVIKPNLNTYYDLIKRSFDRNMVVGVGDQVFLNKYFQTFNPLPTYYNVPKLSNTILEKQLHSNNTSYVKIIHFICKKVWKCKRIGMDTCGCGIYSFNKVWWDTFDEACKGMICPEYN